MADRGVGFLASQLVKGFGGAQQAFPAEFRPLNDFSLLWGLQVAYSATLLRDKQLQKSLRSSVEYGLPLPLIF